MKSNLSSKPNRGFTLMELMVAMAITTIIVTILVSVTSMALDTWNRSRAEVRAARQAKAMVDALGRDLESLVVRRGNTNEWLSATYGPDEIQDSERGPTSLKSTNSAELVLFSAATDRYNGEIGVNNQDKGGDISCVGYTLKWKDPVSSENRSKTFVLNRYLVNPDITFNSLLGKDNLASAFSAYETELDEKDKFVCENVYQFTMTFHVEVTRSSSGNAAPEVITVPISLGNSSGSNQSKQFIIAGDGIQQSAGGSIGASADEIKAGRVKSVEISLTVLSDAGVDQLRAGRNLDTAERKAEFITKHGFHFSKVIQLPGT